MQGLTQRHEHGIDEHRETSSHHVGPVTGKLYLSYITQWNNKETCSCSETSVVIIIPGWMVPTVKSKSVGNHGYDQAMCILCPLSTLVYPMYIFLFFL